MSKTITFHKQPQKPSAPPKPTSPPPQPQRRDSPTPLHHPGREEKGIPRVPPTKK